eukprot:Ihof_evm2s216 gene=Ihof_evmTU2s216
MESLRRKGLVGNVHNTFSAAQYGIVNQCGMVSTMLTHPALINRLGMYRTLQDHGGCVNTLAWSEDGSLLVSGSDDRHAIIWDYATGKIVKSLATGHTNNVFGACLLPYTNNSIMVTGAGDGEVRMHFLDRDPTTTVLLGRHEGRVKRIVIEPESPYVWFSASEDGTVRQYDRRVQGEGTVLLELSKMDSSGHVPRRQTLFGMRARFEIKTMAIKENQPQYIAVGCNDPYVRVYDRRMLEGSALSQREVLCRNFSPSSLARVAASKGYMGRSYVTHVTFSPSGNQLLASYGDNQIYLFDINGGHEDVTYKYGSASNIPQTLLPQAEKKRNLGNLAFKKDLWSTAVQYYSEAIHLNPQISILYTNRAAALLKRQWRGDIMATWRDAETALELDPNNRKGYLRLSQALLNLEKLQLAYHVVTEGIRRFPADAQLLEVEAEVMQAIDHKRVKRDKIKTSRNSHKEKRRKKDNSESERGRDMNGHTGEGEGEGEGEGVSTDGGSGLAGSDNMVIDSKPTNESEDRDEDTGSFNVTESETELIESEEAEGENENESENDNDNQDEDTSDSLPTRRIQLPLHTPIPLRPFSDMIQRYCGHRNTDTDIKEANFFGSQYIVSGSDDGRIYIWHKASSHLIGNIKADSHVVNCVQPHPFETCLASSGIDSTVKLWAPTDIDQRK